MNAARAGVRDLEYGLSGQFALDIQVPGLHVRLFRVSVQKVDLLSEGGQQAGTAAARLTEATGKWIGEERRRRQPVIQAGEHGRGADESGLRHRIRVAAI